MPRSLTQRPATSRQWASASLALLGLILVIVWLAQSAALAQKPTPGAKPVTPELALQKLKAGNERFVNEQISTGKPTAARRDETADSQHPFAVIVGCADSRTSPEIIFDQNIGDVFVVRTAGNLVDDHGLGSIEYAVNVLGSRLIVVLAHSKCGAVKAAMESKTAAGHMESLVRDIQPAVEAARNRAGDPLSNCIHANAALMADKIRRQAQLGERAVEVRIVTGYYDIATGKVEWDQEIPANAKRSSTAGSTDLR